MYEFECSKYLKEKTVRKIHILHTVDRKFVQQQINHQSIKKREIKVNLLK